jgi:hypothetical protein
MPVSCAAVDTTPMEGRRRIQRAYILKKAAVRETAAQCDRQPGGSINEVGYRFQSFRINDLEMVDQTGIEPVTS